MGPKHPTPSNNNAKSIDRWDDEGGAPSGGGHPPPKPPKRPRDFSQAAKLVVDIATGAKPNRDPTPEEEGKDPAAVALGRKGGVRGGKARAAKMTEDQRKAAARKAAAARWGKPKAGGA
jgi:hypothetical protein